MTRSEVRSTLVVLVLVVVAVIALWPRHSAGGPGVAETGVTTSDSASAPAPSAPPSSDDPSSLAAARATAGLAPCPTTPGTTTPGSTTPGTTAPGAAPAGGPLAGLVLDCLGAPGRVDLGPALAGRTTLVNLWASWCGPCRAEVPVLAAYAATPGAAGVLGVAVQDTPTASLSLLSTLGAHYPSVSDPGAVVARRAGAVPVLPASVVVRPDGAVVPVPAEVFSSVDAVRAAVTRALAAPTTGTG